MRKISLGRITVKAAAQPRDNLHSLYDVHLKHSNA